MTKTDAEKVEAFLNDLVLMDPSRHELVETLRQLVRTVVPDVSERMMYGGLIFTLSADFCGVFAYKQHVSVEFGQGVLLEDSLGVLEGGGKYRRHIKLSRLAEIETKQVCDYVLRASLIQSAG